MMAKGLFRASLVADKFGPCELIPADLVAYCKIYELFHDFKNKFLFQKVTNMVIAAAWKTALDRHLGSHASLPQVYHISSGATNPLKWKELTDWSVMHGRHHPLG